MLRFIVIVLFSGTRAPVNKASCREVHMVELILHVEDT